MIETELQDLGPWTSTDVNFASKTWFEKIEFFFLVLLLFLLLFPSSFVVYVVPPLSKMDIVLEPDSGKKI